MVPVALGAQGVVGLVEVPEEGEGDWEGGDPEVEVRAVVVGG